MSLHLAAINMGCMQKSRWTRGKGALVSARFDTWASVRWRDQYPCRSHCVSVSQVEFVVAFGPPASTGFPCVYIWDSGLDRLPPSQSLPITGLPFQRASQVYLLVAVLKPRLAPALNPSSPSLCRRLVVSIRAPLRKLTRCQLRPQVLMNFDKAVAFEGPQKGGHFCISFSAP